MSVVVYGGCVGEAIHLFEAGVSLTRNWILREESGSVHLEFLRVRARVRGLEGRGEDEAKQHIANAEARTIISNIKE